MVKCLETLWQILVNDEDILVVMLLSTMNPIRRFETPGVWNDPSAGSGVLSAELLGSPVSQAGGWWGWKVSQMIREGAKLTFAAKYFNYYYLGI